MSSSTSGPHPPRGRLAEAAASVPLVTLAIFCACVCVYVADNLGDFYACLRDFSLVPSLVLPPHYQVYRIVTAAYTHGSLLHVGMNMLSLLALGGGLEPTFGSLQYALVQVLLTVACGVTYIGLCALAHATVLPGYIHAGAVGFSGVLFAMAVDEASLSSAPSRSVFGLFSVPTALYPWVLMAAMQLIMPNVSLAGHLAGILVGFAHAWGGFKWLLPSLPTLRRWEASPWLARVVRLPQYKLVPGAETLRERAVWAPAAVWGTAVGWAGGLLRPITDCVRGRRGAAAALAPASQPGGGESRGTAAAVGAAAPIAGRRVVEDGRLVMVGPLSGAAGGGGVEAGTPAPSAPPPLGARGASGAASGFTMAVRPAAGGAAAKALPADAVARGGEGDVESPPPSAPAMDAEPPPDGRSHRPANKAAAAALARLAAGPRGGYARLDVVGGGGGAGAASPGGQV